VFSSDDVDLSSQRQSEYTPLQYTDNVILSQRTRFAEALDITLTIQIESDLEIDLEMMTSIVQSKHSWVRHKRSLVGISFDCDFCIWISEKCFHQFADVCVYGWLFKWCVIQGSFTQSRDHRTNAVHLQWSIQLSAVIQGIQSQDQAIRFPVDRCAMVHYKHSMWHNCMCRSNIDVAHFERDNYSMHFRTPMTNQYWRPTIANRSHVDSWQAFVSDRNTAHYEHIRT
jgi:hypothetical protein